jgi:hypothetical protein
MSKAADFLDNALQLEFDQESEDFFVNNSKIICKKLEEKEQVQQQR